MRVPALRVQGNRYRFSPGHGPLMLCIELGRSHERFHSNAGTWWLKISAKSLVLHVTEAIRSSTKCTHIQAHMIMYDLEVNSPPRSQRCTSGNDLFRNSSKENLEGTSSSAVKAVRLGSKNKVRSIGSE